MISIAICTFNRADQLQVLLDNLSGAQPWLDEHAEIIVIDNNSADNTVNLVESYVEDLPIRVVTESQQGLANARNRALLEFRGHVILFLDDDVSIELSTLECYQQALENRPECQYFGGRIKVDWCQGPPKWLKSDDLVLLKGLFGEYSLGDNDIEYQQSSLGPYGANFLLRRSLIEQVGRFNKSLGVNADGLGRGEETDYFLRAREKGIAGAYLAQAVVGHRFQEQRISINYLYRYGIEKGRASVLFDKTYAPGWRLTALRFAVRGCMQLLKGRRDRFYQCVINIGIARGVALAREAEHNSAGATQHDISKEGS